MKRFISLIIPVIICSFLIPVMASGAIIQRQKNEYYQIEGNSDESLSKRFELTLQFIHDLKGKGVDHEVVPYLKDLGERLQKRYGADQTPVIYQFYSMAYNGYNVYVHLSDKSPLLIVKDYGIAGQQETPSIQLNDSPPASVRKWAYQSVFGPEGGGSGPGGGGSAPLPPDVLEGVAVLFEYAAATGKIIETQREINKIPREIETKKSHKCYFSIASYINDDCTDCSWPPLMTLTSSRTPVLTPNPDPPDNEIYFLLVWCEPLQRFTLISECPK
ncbi:MAG: hypothetical protein JXA79_12870 [Deltaproteobacteria bacterium]|nr:hypothetical protein [Deltaproteobacteria bacterium]